MFLHCHICMIHELQSVKKIRVNGGFGVLGLPKRLKWLPSDIQTRSQLAAWPRQSAIKQEGLQGWKRKKTPRRKRQGAKNAQLLDLLVETCTEFADNLWGADPKS